MDVARMSWWVAQLLLSGSWIHTSLLLPNYLRQRLKLCRADSLCFRLSVCGHHYSTVFGQVSVRFSGSMAVSCRYTLSMVIQNILQMLDLENHGFHRVWSVGRILKQLVAEFQRDFLTADNRLEEIPVVVLDPGCGLDHWIVMLWTCDYISFDKIFMDGLNSL